MMDESKDVIKDLCKAIIAKHTADPGYTVSTTEARETNFSVHRSRGMSQAF